MVEADVKTDAATGPAAVVVEMDDEKQPENRPGVRSLVLVGVVVVAALCRLVPHPPNFAPIDAMALFGAAHFRRKWAAFLVPLAAMLASDLVLELAYHLRLLPGWLGLSRGFHSGMWIIFLTVLLISALGLVLRRKMTPAKVAGCVLASSVLFFLVTNFAWWAGYDLFPHTFAGLMQSYAAGVPFFHWTLLGDAFYATVLFGGFALAQHYWPVLRAAPESV
jgi:hypothetical protein